MTGFTGIMVYVIIWFVVLFTVLPFGVKRPTEVEEGHDPGAPDQPMLWRKALATTVITTLLWGVVYLLIENDFLSFRGA